MKVIYSKYRGRRGELILRSCTNLQTTGLGVKNPNMLRMSYMNDPSAVMGHTVYCISYIETISGRSYKKWGIPDVVFPT